MRISLISAAVCCALFPLISVSAAGLSVEQRLAQLEARLNLAEQQASEASRREAPSMWRRAADRAASSSCREMASTIMACSLLTSFSKARLVDS